MAYPNTQLFINGKWRAGAQRQDHRGAQSRDGRDDRHRRACGEIRPRRSAGRRGRRVQGLARGIGVRPLQDHAQGRRHHARAQRRNRAAADDGAGQDAGRSQDGSDGRRRRHRVVRRGSQARLRPDHSGARAGHLSDGHQGAGRSGRGLHALEFPDQPGGAQALRRAGVGMLDHRQGAGGNPGVARAADPRLCRCRRAGRRDQSRLRRAVGDFGISDPASGDPQDLLHRLDRGRQATCRRWPACT